MSIEVIVYEIKRVSDSRTVNVGVKAYVTVSPSEGYDCEKLASLERDLARFVEDRLRGALKEVER